MRSQTCGALAETDPKFKPFLLSLFPSCSPGGNQAGGQRLPSQTFFFPGQRDCHPFQFSETLLCFHFHSSDITGKRNWTDVLVILRQLLNRIQGSQRGQKPRPLNSSYSLLTGYPASPAQVASHFNGEERDTAHLQTHMANRVVTMTSIPHCVLI